MLDFTVAFLMDFTQENVVTLTLTWHSRSPSKRYARRTVGGTTREAIMEERVLDGYRTIPHHSTSMDSFRQLPPADYSHPRPAIPNSTSYPNSLRSGSTLQTSPHRHNSPPHLPAQLPAQPPAQQQQPQQQPFYVNQPNTHTSSDTFQHNSVRATLPNDYKPNDFSTKSRNGWATMDPRTSHTAATRPNLDTSRTDSRFSRSFDSRSDQGSLPSTLENRSGQRARALLNRQNKSPVKTVDANGKSDDE